MRKPQEAGQFADHFLGPIFTSASLLGFEKKTFFADGVPEFPFGAQLLQAVGLRFDLMNRIHVVVWKCNPFLSPVGKNSGCFKLSPVKPKIV